jgi:formylglycine-generating enzyme required for sulfatase activity
LVVVATTLSLQQGCGDENGAGAPSATAPAAASTGTGASGVGVAGPAETLSVDLGGGVKMEFVLIRPGSFMMGSDAGSDSEKPAHKVNITKPFYLAKYEVTQAQWRAVMGEDQSYYKGDANPVDSVSWNDCQTFLSKLSEKAGGVPFRLPTEAEWEYACRAGSTAKYSFGDSDSDLVNYAWYTANSGNTSHPVGEKKPNAWGLYDMHGNVWEWCQDWYANYPAGDVSDPQGPSSGHARVLRGGGWGVIEVGCRSAYRLSYDPAGSDYGRLGLRAARSLE